MKKCTRRVFLPLAMLFKRSLKISVKTRKKKRVKSQSSLLFSPQLRLTKNWILFEERKQLEGASLNLLFQRNLQILTILSLPNE